MRPPPLPLVNDHLSYIKTSRQKILIFWSTHDPLPSRQRQTHSRSKRISLSPSSIGKRISILSWRDRFDLPDRAFVWREVVAEPRSNRKRTPLDRRTCLRGTWLFVLMLSTVRRPILVSPRVYTLWKCRENIDGLSKWINQKKPAGERWSFVARLLRGCLFCFRRLLYRIIDLFRNYNDLLRFLRNLRKDSSKQRGTFDNAKKLWNRPF